MKPYNIILKTILFVLSSVTILPVTIAQNAKKDMLASKIASTKKIIEAQNFVFVPQTILPMRESSRLVTSYYELAVSKDTLKSYLPFFGRAYTAPLLPADNAFDFTSTNFEYKIKIIKKAVGILQ